MKCEGCPVAYHVYGFQDNRVGNPKVHKWYPNDVCRSRREPCHLTPDQLEAIRKAIAGEGRLFALTREEMADVVSCYWYAEAEGFGCFPGDSDITDFVSLIEAMEKIVDRQDQGGGDADL